MRKVLSFVLVLALVLGSFSFAFGLTDIEDSANKDAIQVCNDLGIIDGYPDGTFQGEKAVNRAEFAAMITRALGVPDSALAGYATTSFKDVAGYSWAVKYLAFCESKGIMLGDGMGNAMPGRTISVNEAITMALRAVGYTENSALLVGTWPSNYVTLGQQKGLYTDLATATTIDRENAAQVIYNALTVDLVAVNADGKTELTVTNGQNMLEAYLDCEDAGKGFIAIVTDEAFGFDDTVINVADKVGAYGQTWKNSDGDLVAFVPDGVKMVGKYNGAAGKFVSDGTKYTLGTSTYATTAAVVIGNDTVTTSMGGVFGFAVIDKYEGYGDQSEVTIWADVSGTKITKIYSVVAWQAIAGDQAASDVQEDIEEGTLLGESFVLNDDDSIDTSSFNLVGVNELEDIAEDDVVYVYTDSDDYIRLVKVGQNTVTGTIEEVDTANNAVVVDGTTYKYAVLPGTNAEITPNSLNAGDEGTLYLDADGYIFAFDAASTSIDNFGIVMWYNKASGVDSAKVKLYTAADSSSTYDIDSDVEWTENGYANWTSASGLGYTAASPNGIQGLVGYSLNADGKVDAINVSGTALSGEVLTTDVIFNGTLRVSDDVIVYSVSDGGIDLEVEVVSISEVVKGIALTSGAFFTDSDNVVVALVVDYTCVDTTEDDATLAVFNTKTEVKNSDDKKVNKLTGFVDGISYTGLTKSKTVAANATAGSFFLYDLTIDSNDVITSIARVGAATTANVKQLGVTTGAAVTTSGIASDKAYISLVGGTAAKVTLANVDTLTVYKYDPVTEKFSVGSLRDIGRGDWVKLYDVGAAAADRDNKADIIIYQDK